MGVNEKPLEEKPVEIRRNVIEVVVPNLPPPAALEADLPPRSFDTPPSLEERRRIEDVLRRSPNEAVRLSDLMTFLMGRTVGNPPDPERLPVPIDNNDEDDESSDSDSDSEDQPPFEESNVI